MDQGWIKLYRCSIDSKVFQNEGIWKLWCMCLMKANHKKGWFASDATLEPVEIIPGQFITGRFSLHKDYYPSKGKNQKSPLTLWRWLQFLEKCGNLNIKTNNKYSLITIINWDTYQIKESQDEQPNEQQVNNRRTTGEQQVNTNKNEKNEKKKDKTFCQDSIEYRLAKLLFNEILKNNPEHKEPNLQGWSKYVDRMIRLDKRDPKKIAQVIRWCQKDDFWHKNILSTSKLKNQYDQLFTKMKDDAPLLTEQRAPIHGRNVYK